MTDEQLLAAFNSAESVIDGLHEVRALLSASPAGAAVSISPRLRTVINFLLGECPLDGIWFSDAVKPAFWWRKELRGLASQPDTQEKVE